MDILKRKFISWIKIFLKTAINRIQKIKLTLFQIWFSSVVQRIHSQHQSPFYRRIFKPQEIRVGLQISGLLLSDLLKWLTQLRRQILDLRHVDFERHRFTFINDCFSLEFDRTNHSLSVWERENFFPLSSETVHVISGLRAVNVIRRSLPSFSLWVLHILAGDNGERASLCFPPLGMLEHVPMIWCTSCHHEHVCII